MYNKKTMSLCFFLTNWGRKVGGGSTRPKRLERPEDNCIQATWRLPLLQRGAGITKQGATWELKTLEQKKDRVPRYFLSSKTSDFLSHYPFGLPWLCWARAWERQGISRRGMTSTISFRNYFPIYLSTFGSIERDKPTQSYSAPGTTTPERECIFKALWIPPSWIA